MKQLRVLSILYKMVRLLDHNMIPIDNYAKDGGPGVVWLLCSFYHEHLRSLILKEV